MRRGKQRCPGEEVIYCMTDNLPSRGLGLNLMNMLEGYYSYCTYTVGLSNYESHVARAQGRVARQLDSQTGQKSTWTTLPLQPTR
jgi:hypothetical protein